MHVRKGLVGSLAVVLAWTLSACGGNETPPEETTPPAQTQEPTETETNTQPGDDVPGQTITVDDEGIETLVITVDDKKHTFKRSADDVWPSDEVMRLYHLILGEHGYWSTRNHIERPNNHEGLDCEWVYVPGANCRFEIAFGYADDVYWIDTAEADRCTLYIKFEDRFSFDAAFWLIDGDDTKLESYGDDPTRDDLYALGQDALPCRGVAVG